MIRGDPPHPRLELRRGSQPHPHRARSGEHDPAPALRHRPHPGARARRRRNHAQSGQEPAPGPRLAEDDRERLLSGQRPAEHPSGRPPSLGRQPSTHEGRPVMPGCRNARVSRSTESPSPAPTTTQSRAVRLQRHRRQPVGSCLRTAIRGGNSEQIYRVERGIIRVASRPAIIHWSCYNFSYSRNGAGLGERGGEHEHSLAMLNRLLSVVRLEIFIDVVRNLSTTLRQRRSAFTEQFAASSPRPVG